MAVKIVKDVDDAIAHINRHSTKHSDSIVTKEETNARRFLKLVDSAAGVLECLHPLYRRWRIWLLCGDGD